MSPGPRTAAIPLATVLLTLVEARPGVTGYDLAAALSRAANRFFTTTPSQIYPSLRGLLDQGLVAAEDQTTAGGRAKTAYRVTPAGRAALDEFYARPVAYTGRYADFGYVLLALTYLPRADPGVVRARTEELRDFLVADRAAALAGPAAAGPLTDLVHAFVVADLDHKITWLDEVLAALPAG